MILVVGSLNMDLVARVERLPRPGETVLGGDYEAHPGGKGANQAVAAARLGARVRMLGRVGEDAFGRALLANLAEEGVETEGILRTPGPSGVALIAVDREGQNLIVVAPGANARLRPEDLDPRAFQGVRVLLLQLETPPETVERAAALGRTSGALVILNAAPARPLPQGLLGLVDLLLVNETEAATLLDRPPPRSPAEARAAAQALASRLPRVVLTLGAQGAVWAEGEAWGHQEAFPVRAVDTVAAGDAFAGGLAVALLEGRPFGEALRWAAAAGALAVTREGAQPALPRRGEVEALVREGRG